jgi:hypothetical protein
VLSQREIRTPFGLNRTAIVRQPVLKVRRKISPPSHQDTKKTKIGNAIEQEGTELTEKILALVPTSVCSCLKSLAFLGAFPPSGRIQSNVSLW